MHIAAVVALAPDDQHIFVMDNLNTHQSETLGRFVIRHDHWAVTAKELGVKGPSGILANQKTRKAFLGDAHHPIRLIYTPKHCAWWNQIAWGLSIITRRLLNKRSSFSSVAALEERIQQFIDYYNEHLAKPFKWTYDGKLLKI